MNTPRMLRQCIGSILTNSALRVTGLRAARVLLGAAALINAGCFHERSFPMRTKDRVPLRYETGMEPHDVAEISTREWLTKADRELRPLLPDKKRPTMITEDMVNDQGRPQDVYAFFDRKIEKMQGLTDNWWALQDTAQSIEQHEWVDIAPPVWPGFESVWVPVARDVQLHAFVGFAQQNGKIAEADCIVMLPGLWGDNGAKRNKDLALALQQSGFHVLSLEQRGHGQTEAKLPNVYYNYGVIESQDLMKVSEWLQDTYPQVRRTGLIGFCWGANAALLAAWYDGRTPDDPGITENVARHLQPISPRRHYTAGMLAYSPVLRWEDFLDVMDTPRSMWTDPSPAMFQKATRSHMARKGFPEVSGNLRHCINYDFARSIFGPSFPMADAYRFMRLLPYRGLPDGDKLERSRVPVLLIHSVNDPLQTAQEVVDLIAQTSNPKVAALMMPGGGHIGFQAYARSHFYSLILNFFDPVVGAAAHETAGLTQRNGRGAVNN